jgi:hypothetical protein
MISMIDAQKNDLNDSNRNLKSAHIESMWKTTGLIFIITSTKD